MSRDPAWRLLEAVEILHAHVDGSFASRLAASTGHLLPGSVYALDLFMPDGSHIVENNIPFDRQLRELIHSPLCAEILLRDHPVCAKLLDGTAGLGRLSDLVDRRSFEETELFRSMYRHVDLNFQVFAPLPLPVGRGAISIDRDNRDFTNEEVRLVGHFVRHVQHAYATELRLRERPVVAEETEGHFRDRLVPRGFTKREVSVLYWLSRGKRNAEVALILGIATRTVEVHMANSFRKLDVDCRAAALLELREICS